jgi:hypothetical protein
LQSYHGLILLLFFDDVARTYVPIDRSHSPAAEHWALAASAGARCGPNWWLPRGWKSSATQAGGKGSFEKPAAVALGCARGRDVRGVARRGSCATRLLAARLGQTSWPCGEEEIVYSSHGGLYRRHHQPHTTQSLGPQLDAVQVSERRVQELLLVREDR